MSGEVMSWPWRRRDVVQIGKASLLDTAANDEWDGYDEVIEANDGTDLQCNGWGYLLIDNCALSIRRQGSTFLRFRFARYFWSGTWRECGMRTDESLTRTIYHTMVLTSYNLSIYVLHPEQPKRTQHVDMVQHHKQSPINADPEGTSPSKKKSQRSKLH